MPSPSVIDALDRRIIEATQEGLPLVPRPYDAAGARIGISGREVRERLEGLLRSGIVRRIGAIPNHYALGLLANGMSVWDVEDRHVASLGPRVGALAFVTHCYSRPRHLPRWPYNLFAMVHGHDREDVRRKVGEIGRLLGSAAARHEVLFSTCILKKTGLRIAAEKEAACSD